MKDVDKFEMIFQALEYEKAEGRKGDLEEFFVHTVGECLCREKNSLYTSPSKESVATECTFFYDHLDFPFNAFSNSSKFTFLFSILTHPDRLKVNTLNSLITAYK